MTNVSMQLKSGKVVRSKAGKAKHTVLSVLPALVGNMVYLEDYERGGLPVEKDDRVVHGPFRTLHVVGLQSSGSMNNFSLQCAKEVKILSESDGTSLIDKRKPMTYNVVRNGKLHVYKFKAVLNRESFGLLKSAGVIVESGEFSSAKVYSIDLRKVQLVNPISASAVRRDLVNLLRKEKELESAQTAINARIKSLKSDDRGETEEKDDVGHPKDVKAATKYYNAAHVEYKLMGYKTNDNCNYDAQQLDLELANFFTKDIRRQLVAVRLQLREMIFAMETYGSKVIRWDAGTRTKRGLNAKLEQTAVFCGATLKRVTWRERHAC